MLVVTTEEPSPKSHFHSETVAPPAPVDAMPLNCTVVLVVGAVGEDVKLAVTPLPTIVKLTAAVAVWPVSSVTVTVATYVPTLLYVFVVDDDVVVAVVPSPKFQSYRVTLCPLADAAAAVNVVTCSASGVPGETTKVVIVGGGMGRTATTRTPDVLEPAASVAVNVTE